MGRGQWIAVACAVALLLLTYLGCPIRPPEEGAALDQAPLEATGLQSLIRSARADLSPAQMATLASLEERLETQTDPEKRTEILEQLAGEWYRAGQPAISGVYAVEIAEEVNTAEAWGIAGTTFTLCLQREDAEGKNRQFCGQQAERAYQNAISLDPANPDHRINLALAYVDNPPPDEPMRAVLMLKDLEAQYPENARVYLTLGQLSVKTGQLENAAKRYAQAAQLEPNNPDAVCQLARLYEQLGQTDEATFYGDHCEKLVRELRARRAAATD